MKVGGTRRSYNMYSRGGEVQNEKNEAVMVGALFVLILSGPGDLTNILVKLLRSPRTNTPLRLYLVNLLLGYFQGSQGRQTGQSRGRR